jgi:hypothetical protein
VKSNKKWVVLVLFIISVILFNSFFLFSSRKTHNKYYHELVYQLEYDMRVYTSSVNQYLVDEDDWSLLNLMSGYGQIQSSYGLWASYAFYRFDLDMKTYNKITDVYNILMDPMISIRQIALNKEQEQLSNADKEKIQHELNILREIHSMMKYENIKNRKEIIKTFSNLNI